MGAIVGTKVLCTEMCGTYRIGVIKCTPGSASDTVTLTTAANVAAGLGFTSIDALLGANIIAGQDANLVAAQVARTSATQLTVVTKGADGANATNWTSAYVNIAFLGQ